VFITTKNNKASGVIAEKVPGNVILPRGYITVINEVDVANGKQ